MIWRQVYLPGWSNWRQESRSCYLLVEWTLGSQVILLRLHSHICKMGSLPQRLCVDETQYSPKSVSFCEDTWGEDLYTSDLLRGKLSGNTRLLGTKKGKELSKSWNFLQIFSFHLIPWGAPEQNYTTSDFLNWGKDTRLSQSHSWPSLATDIRLGLAGNFESQALLALAMGEEASRAQKWPSEGHRLSCWQKLA